MIEKELVWEELGLDSILSYEKSLEEKLDHKLLKNQKGSVLKHSKMLKKPTYAVVMNRYNSTPHKPKLISKTKLDELADPVLGKLTHHVRLKLKGQELPHRYGNSNSPQKTVSNDDGDERTDNRLSQQNFLMNYIPNSASPTKVSHPFQHMSDLAKHSLTLSSSQKSLQKGTAYNSIDEAFLSPIIEENKDSPFSKKSDDLFLTGLEDSGTFHNNLSRQQQNSSNFIAANIQNNKNSFASMLRDRIQQATKINKLVQPMDLEENHQTSPIKGRSDITDAVGSKNHSAHNQNGSQRKAKLQQNINKMNKVKNQPINQRGIKFKPSGNQTDNSKKTGGTRGSVIITNKNLIKSSGYGSQVKRYSNQPKAMVPPRKKEISRGEKSEAKNRESLNLRKRREAAASKQSTFLTADEDETSQKSNSRMNRLVQSRNKGAVRISSSVNNRKKRDPSVDSRRSNISANEKSGINRKNGLSSSLKESKSMPLMKDKRTKAAEPVNVRNYSTKRSVASVPVLLREKVQQSRPYPVSSVFVDSDAQITKHDMLVNDVPSSHQIVSEEQPYIGKLEEENKDLSSIINKLQSFEKSKSSSSLLQAGGKKKPSDNDIQDKQMTTLLKKHAEKLNSYLTNAENHLSEYQQLKDTF
jgi:hypothetical protein